jgi:hypothetical protein
VVTRSLRKLAGVLDEHGIATVTAPELRTLANTVDRQGPNWRKGHP